MVGGGALVLRAWNRRLALPAATNHPGGQRRPSLPGRAPMQRRSDLSLRGGGGWNGWGEEGVVPAVRKMEGIYIAK